MRKPLFRLLLGVTMVIALSLGLVSVALAQPAGSHLQATRPAQPPVVACVAPNSGPTDGGQVVVILGSGFRGATGVAFGSAPAGSFTVCSPFMIVATAPAGTAGQAVDVTVTTAVATSAVGTRDLFTYLAPQAPAVLCVAPKWGPAAGGTLVVILGSGLQGATGVSFGTVPATSFTVYSPFMMTAVTPAGTAGQMVDVTVTNAAGTSAVATSDQFTYGGLTPAP